MNEEEKKQKITVSLDQVIVEVVNRKLKVKRLKELEDNKKLSSFSSIINSLLSECIQRRAM